MSENLRIKDLHITCRICDMDFIKNMRQNYGPSTISEDELSKRILNHNTIYHNTNITHTKFTETLQEEKQSQTGFKLDFDKMFIVDTIESVIYEYDVTIPGERSSAVYVKTHAGDIHLITHDNPNFDLLRNKK